jgi:5-methyltetrahydrofolate--homocysteine methyltransferase
MSRLLHALRSGRVLLMDGAMGTELLRSLSRPAPGQPPVDLSSLNTIDGGALVRAVHRAYVDAGAEVLVTNTFCVQPSASFETYQAAFALARTALTGSFVLADVGPGFPANDAALGRVLSACDGADGLLIETLSDPNLVEALAKANPSLPRLASFSFGFFDGRIRTHASLLPHECAEAARRCGCAALGVNCGRDIGLPELLEVIAAYRSVTDLPLFVRPNAGTPVEKTGRLVYRQTPEMMAGWLPALLEAGVTMVGGCCGTTPAHIAAYRHLIDDWNRAHSQNAIPQINAD